MWLCFFKQSICMCFRNCQGSVKQIFPWKREIHISKAQANLAQAPLCCKEKACVYLPYNRTKKTAAAKSLQSVRLPCPWDSPGKNSGVGCHFLLQCMKVKSEREVAQWCLTLSDPMDCSLPGSSIHGIFQARVLEWGAIAFAALLSTLHQT